jgi:hypothetical protein
MAFEYQSYASLGLNLNRQKYGPLDISNVFTSENDLKYYLTKGTHKEGVSEYWTKVTPYPYEGQVLATVINGVVSVYALSLDAEGNFQTQEIGAKIETDDKTIRLVDGKLELVGLPTDTAGKTYVPSYVNGVLTWAEPDTSTAEGQQQAIDGLNTAVASLGSVVNGKPAEGVEGEEGYVAPVVGLVDKVAALEAVDNATQAELDAYKEVVTAAIAAGVKEAKDYADAQDADTVYDDKDLQDRVKAIEDDYLKEEDKYDDTAVKGRLDVIESDYLKKSDETIYDDTALAGRVTTVEGKVTALEQAVEAIDFVDADELDAAIDEAVETINETLNTKAAQSDLEALEGRVDAFLTGTGATEALDSLQELIKYINEHDDVEISGILADIEAIEGKLAGVDGTVVDYVTGAINALKIGDYAKASDLTALAGRVEALEAKPFDTYATKTEVETVDGKFANYTTTDTLNGLLADKADADSVVANTTFITFQTENTAAIATAKQEAIDAAAEAEEAKGYAVATEVAGTYATKSELTEAVEGIENDLLSYAKTADVNAELAKKVESATIAHAVAADPEKGIEAIPEGITKEGTTLKIVVDAPTRAETTQMIADKVAAVTGGESAAAVKLLVEAETERSTAKDEAHDAALAKLNGEATVAGSVAEAKAQADKGVADAAKVAADLVTANTAIDGNTREIATVKSNLENVNTNLGGKITALETAKGEQATQISGIDGRLTTAESSITTNSTDINTIKGQITALGNEDTRLAGLITDLQTSKANAADVYTKGEVDTKVQEAIDAIPDVDFTGYATEKYVDDAIAVVNEEVGKKANAADVYTITQADNKFVAETALNDKIDARVNTLIDGANSEDTITNVTNLVAYVNDNAGDIAKLVSDVEANRTDIEGNADAIAKNAEDIVAINDWIKTVVQPKASTEVSVAEDGTLGINEVNVNKLVQTAGDTLVLNGGNAGVKVEA